MQFSRDKFNLALIVTLIVIIVVESNEKFTGYNLFDVTHDLEHYGFSRAFSLLETFPSPVGDLFGGDILSIQEIFFFFNSTEKYRNLTPGLVTIQKKFLKLVNNSVQISKYFDEEMESVLKLRNSLKKMESDLEDIFQMYSKYFGCVIQNICYDLRKNDIFHIMIEYSSIYRQTLRSFIPSYIIQSGRNDYGNDFFKLILQNGTLSRDNDDDCYSESIQTRIFKTWMHITNVLTKGYSIVIAAHTVHYQDLMIKRSVIEEITEALRTRQKLMDIMKEYFTHMKVIIREANWAMNHSSREIRNCGSFNLKKGVTFEPLKLIETRLKFFKTSTNLSTDCEEYYPAQTEIYEMRFHILNCTEIEDPYLNIYVNPEDEERYFHYINIIRGGKVAEINGKIGNISLHKITIFNDSHNCKNQKCDGIRWNRVKISTQLVRAELGCVVTGIRWRIQNNTIYLDIQEAKFIDGSRVDEKTVHWSETPINNKKVKYLGMDLRSIVLADIILPEKNYITGVMLSAENGLITLIAIGRTTNDYGIELLPENEKRYQNSRLRNLTEFKIDEPDNPEVAPENEKKLIMRIQNKYFIKFQPSSYKKDLGRTTIPYLDIREIVTKPSAPISGLGIFYEALPGYGGFLGLKMFSPDFSYMIDEKKFDSFFNETSVY